MMVFLAMALIFGMVYPLATSASRSATTYDQSISLAQHKIDQLRGFNWNGQNMATASACSTLSTKLVNTGLADSCSGTGPITCSFASVDHVVANGTTATSGLLPAGSTATFTLSAATGVPSGQAYSASVALAWTGGGIPAGSLTMPAEITQLNP